jgi:hypothetical protein
MLGRSLDVWLHANVAYSDDPFNVVDLEGDEDFVPVKQLWSALGVTAEGYLDLLAEVRPYFRDGKLYVSEHLEQLPDGGRAKIRYLLVWLWRFRKFAESRWLTTSRSASAMVAGFLTGLEGLVALVRSIPGNSDFYLKGFGFLNPPGRRDFFVKTAVAGCVADAVQAKLLLDDRVHVIVEEIEDVMAEKLHKLHSISPQVWQLLARITGADWLDFRNETLTSAHISACYFTHGTLRDATQWPWCLCRGDIRANLLELGSMTEPPHEPATMKIWDCLQSPDISLETVVELVELLKLIPWSSNGVEQVHGSGALFKREHPDYGLEIREQNDWNPSALEASGANHQGGWSYH